MIPAASRALVLGKLHRHMAQQSKACAALCGSSPCPYPCMYPQTPSRNLCSTRFSALFSPSMESLRSARACKPSHSEYGRIGTCQALPRGSHKAESNMRSQHALSTQPRPTYDVSGQQDSSGVQGQPVSEQLSWADSGNQRRPSYTHAQSIARQNYTPLWNTQSQTPNTPTHQHNTQPKSLTVEKSGQPQERAYQDPFLPSHAPPQQLQHSEAEPDVQGLVKKVTYRSPQTGYTVLKVQVHPPSTHKASTCWTCVILEITRTSRTTS